MCSIGLYFFFSSRRRHTRWPRDWSSDVCSSDLIDADVERAKRVAADLGTVAYASTEELLDGASPEVVSVAVPEGVRLRSEERRVGKECGARWSAWRCKEKE